ncbi:MarR family winged helix-turn-helix transcriptional regulator [Methanococcoides methylutens]|uniref:Transcriptional regulator, MarR family n=1 Tax=Methanococcoides methylutens MM1 TaxID=1434104 RepID=A0A0E3WZQ5_METMT|nr:MarR family transcriptional regulator [Methanococcoides methylutens]AKB85264.1 Transcriptional regulator, MarR family [Methanococcoides methylutens MM1]
MYEEFVGKHISYLHRYARRYYDRELEPYGIGGAQLQILMPLYKMDGISQELLAQTIKVDKTTIARSIKKLVDKGYILRQTDEKDRRSYRIFLTEKGKTTEHEMMEIFNRWENNLLSKFDNDQRE